ncbi:calcium-binding protein [Aliigemmobacter aestuarii]|nr:hypothetical protein [Gemmobacter aestuarii]
MAVTSRIELESVKIFGDTALESNGALAPTNSGGFLLNGLNESPLIIFPDDLDYRLYDSNGDPAPSLSDGPEGLDPAMALLSNGNIVTTFSTGSNSSFLTIRSADGATQVLAPISVPGSNTDVTSVRATFPIVNNGGFVVAHEFDWGTDRDVRIRFYSNDGTGGTTRTVNGDISFDDYGAKVTQLDNGNIAVAFTREDGGVTSVRYAIYNRDLSTVIQSDALLDGTGSVNEDVAIVATDNGFAVFYEERSPLIVGGVNRIVMQEISSTGTILGRKTIVESSGLFPTNFNDISVTRMDDGLLAVSYVRRAGIGIIGEPIPTDMVVRLVAAAHDDTFASAEVVVRGGGDITDAAARTALARFGANQLAAIYDNPDANAVQGEHLRVVRIHEGDAANDTFTPTALLDRFFGGDGVDTADLSAAGSGVSVDLEANTATGGLATGTTFDSIENLIGTSFADTLLGNAAANLLRGGLGTDSLQGRDGNDTLLGGGGNDTLAGDNGADRALGGAGNDVLRGGRGADTLKGGIGNDRMFGGDGNDRLIGKGGDDRLFGHGGRDELNGGVGNDRIFGGRLVDTLAGQDGNDTLLGERGRDVLLGGRGNDRLDGGGQDDRMTGGAGADVFVFGRNAGVDTITDFVSGVDRIDLVAGVSVSDLILTEIGSDLRITISGKAGFALWLEDTGIGEITGSDFF